MGVKGLWRLLLPIGRRISIETLQGKVLAIDASIWLTQFIKAMRNPETGRVVAAAHLIGFFRRLCRLRFHGIKPVFVFDGATPEIKQRELALRRKRREQFATLGDASLNRLAKRLLAETLRKQKMSKGGGKKVSVEASGNRAFAPGFNPGGDQANNANVHATSGEEGKERESESDTQNETDGKAEGKSASHSVIELLEEGASDKDVPGHEVNDWDNPIPVNSDDDAESRGKDENDSVEYEDFGLRRNDGKFDIDQISSLPAEKRKDAIEDAKRRQRLRSRQEFMPAAANPLQFSQVQLSNFLKSSHLNKSIVEMATKAADKDNRGLRGEAMASDRTTRVELIRENEEAAKEVTTYKVAGKGRLQRAKAAPNNYQNESSDESWTEQLPREVGLASGEDDNSDRKPAAKTWAPTRTRRRVIMTDESDEDESLDGSGGGGFLFSSSAAPSGKSTSNDLDNAKKTSDSRVSAPQENKVESGENSSEERAGFFPSEEVARSMQQPNRVQRIEARVTDNDGGFLSYDEKITDTVVQGINGPVGPKGDHRSDATVAQELADRALAQALQEVEDAESTMQSGESVVVDSALHSVTQAAHRQAETSALDVSLQAEPESHANRSGPSGQDSGDDEENVDWEDGELSDAAHSMSYGEEEDAKDGLDYRAESFRDIAVQGASRRSSAASAVQDRQEIISVESGKSASENEAEWEIAAPTSLVGNSKPGSESLNAETTAALERAQATASNLANWAGRVFRRAMKEVSEANSSKVSANMSPKENREMNGFADTSGEDRESAELRVDNLYIAKEARDSSMPKASPAVGTSEATVPTNDSQDTIEKGEPDIELDPTLLEVDEAEWTTERNQRERDMDTVTDEMRDEAIRLLQLFGVPYVEAPAEAEAQCVALEELGLVDGIVTDDSDAFVFGGQTIYKHIFDEMKYVEVYLAPDAEKEMRLGRNHMVALAMLLGGDYTEGVKGVGIVNAMEALEAFDVSEDLKGGLTLFKKWMDGFDPMDDIGSAPDGSQTTKERIFHSKHRSARTRWAAPESFPSDRVMMAYLNPVVDKSDVPFSWGVPDVENLIKFCGQNIGWRREDTLKFLEPVINNINAGYRQTRIDSFMRYEEQIKFADVKSKRLRDVLGITETEERGPELKRQRK